MKLSWTGVILEAVSNYQKNKGIKDEALELPVDLSILEDNEILAVIEHEYEIGSKRGLSVSAHVGENEGNGSELDVPEPPLGDDNNDNALTTDGTHPFAEDKHKEEVNWTKKVQSYYTRILLFAFITKDTVISLVDIIAVMETIENSRIAKNLGLSKQNKIRFKLFSALEQPYSMQANLLLAPSGMVSRTSGLQ